MSFFFYILKMFWSSFTQKMDPPKRVQRELEAGRKEDDVPQDTRVVVIKEQSPGIQVHIENHSNRVPEEEEEEEQVSIAEQDKPGIGESFDIDVCHVCSINRFFVHRADSEFLDLSQNIQEYYQENSNTDAIIKAKIGTICCAYYIDKWYRARVIVTKTAKTVKDVSNGNASCQYCMVLYVDYGNIELVRSDMIRKLKLEFCTLPAQAIQCRLHGVAPKGEQSDWDEETISYFKTLTQGPLTIHIVDCRDQMLEVELFTGHGKNIAEVLANMGYAIYKGRRPEPGILERLRSLTIDNDEEIEVAKVELPKTESIKILVTFVHNLTEISAIRFGHCDKDQLVVLESAMQAFYDDEETEVIETVQKDCLYAALFEEGWYRVEVIDVRGDEAVIYFVDRGYYGQVKTSDLRELPEQFKRVPMQAIDLTLDSLPDIDTEEYIEALSEMILGKAFEAEIVESISDYTLVQLFDTSAEESVNINEKIAAELNLKEEEDSEQMLPKANEQCDAIVFYISDSGTFFVVLSNTGLNTLVDKIYELSKVIDLKLDSLPDIDTEEYIEALSEMILGNAFEAEIVESISDYTLVQLFDTSAEESVNINEKIAAELNLKEEEDSEQMLPKANEQCDKMWYHVSDSGTFFLVFSNTGLYNLVDMIYEMSKIVKEQTDDEVFHVDILEADPVDSSNCSSIAEEIVSIYENMRQSRESPVMDVTQSAVLESEDSDPFSSPEPTTHLFSSNSVDFTADNSNSVKQETTAEFPERQLSVSSYSSDSICTISGLVIRDVTFPPLRINDSYLMIYVTSVASPSSFYFQLHENLPSLTSLMEDMNQFYKDSKVVFDNYQVGDMCAVFVPEDDCWYRGVVRSLVEIDEEFTVAVFLADFGGNVFRHPTELRNLDQKFQSLPLQAVKGSLADVHPPPNKWPITVCKEFLNRTLRCLLCAKLCIPEATNPVLFSLPSSKRIDVWLYDTYGGGIGVINESFYTS